MGKALESVSRQARLLFIRDFVLTQLTDGLDLNQFIPVADPLAEATEILGFEPEARLIGSTGVYIFLRLYIELASI